jgi:hypothetical protein
MIKQMVMVYTSIKTVHVMRVNGKTISNMVLVKKFGQITVNTKDIILKVKSTVKVYIFGKMDLCIMVTGLKTELKDTENINGKMVDSISENGKTTTCTVKVYTLGPMAEDMKVNMKWIKNMVSESITGLTTEYMRVIGSMENNMVEENTFFKTAQLK